MFNLHRLQQLSRGSPVPSRLIIACSSGFGKPPRELLFEPMDRMVLVQGLRTETKLLTMDPSWSSCRIE